MKILLIGDIVGNSGVKKVMEVIPKFKEENNIDYIIANGENSADGMGITQKIYDNLKKTGIDMVTMGNHTWGKKEIFNFIDDEHIIRPANYPAGVPGVGYRIHECKEKKIAVINLIGRVDVAVLSTCVFGTHTHVQTADETILENGTGYITDIGMTGPKKSVIGMEVEASVKRFVTSLPERYKVSEDNEVVLTGCTLEINDETCRIEKIDRIKL